LHFGSLVKSKCITALLLTLASVGGAQVPRPKALTARDAYWSGAILLASAALSTADVRIARALNEPGNRSLGRDRLARNFAKVQEGTLTVGNLAIWGVARLVGGRNVADVAWHAAESVIVGSVASQVIRGPLGRSRPHVTNFQNQYDFAPFKGFGEFKYRAFPSIHTASAFGVATVYTLETRRRAPALTWIVAPVAYTLASGPGLSRMYTGQHWASDILSGAFVGTLAGVVVMRYNHDVRPDNAINRFFLGRDGVNVSAGQDAMLLSFSRRF
jgi:membrane-associated phospholipid phosphatase